MHASHDPNEIHERLAGLLQPRPGRTEDGRPRCVACRRAAIAKANDGSPVCRIHLMQGQTGRMKAD